MGLWFINSLYLARFRSRLQAACLPGCSSLLAVVVEASTMAAGAAVEPLLRVMYSYRWGHSLLLLVRVAPAAS